MISPVPHRLRLRTKRSLWGFATAAAGVCVLLIAGVAVFSGERPAAAVSALVALGAAAVAAVIDVRTRTIPNWLTTSTFIVGVAATALLARTVMAPGAAAAAATVILYAAMAAMRVVGVGDLKLVAGLSLLLLPAAGPWVAALLPASCAAQLVIAVGQRLLGISTRRPSPHAPAIALAAASVLVAASLLR